MDYIGFRSREEHLQRWPPTAATPQTRFTPWTISPDHDNDCCCSRHTRGKGSGVGRREPKFWKVCTKSYQNTVMFLADLVDPLGDLEYAKFCSKAADVRTSYMARRIVITAGGTERKTTDCRYRFLCHAGFGGPIGTVKVNNFRMASNCDSPRASSELNLYVLQVHN